MHLRVNEHGLPLQIELSPGQAHDAPMAELLLQDLPKGTSLLADRGYDADWIREMIEDQNCTPVIPPKSNRREEIPFSKRKYKKRNLVERCINKLKQFRHIATRYDRYASAYLAFAKLGAIRLWLRFYESAALVRSGPCRSPPRRRDEQNRDDGAAPARPAWKPDALREGFFEPATCVARLTGSSISFMRRPQSLAYACRHGRGMVHTAVDRRQGAADLVRPAFRRADGGA
jgi:transposase